MEQKDLKFNRKKLLGTVLVPGDKSISHRSVMFGAIASGKTKVKNFLLGDDCLSTISCFRKLGVEIDQTGEEIIIYGKGLSGLTEPSEILDVGNSGTTIRLLMGILAGRSFHSVFSGDHSIAKRPMTRVTAPLTEMGANIRGRNQGEFTPISLTGGRLKSIEYTLPMASAQVKSALLFAGLQAEGTTIIHEPAKTRDHTERMIRQFGGVVETNDLSVKIKGGQSLKAANITVPGDISSAAFFLVAAAITKDSEVALKNVGLNPTRSGIIDVMKEMGANILVDTSKDNASEPAGDLVVTASELKGTIIEGDMIPRLIDEIPIIALLATQAEGKTIIKDAHELKVKETNRIDTVVNELKKLGANIQATEDGMVIEGKSLLRGGKVSSHGDHRIGMMLAVAALICSGPVTLENADAISVSYPNFFSDLEGLITN